MKGAILTILSATFCLLTFRLEAQNVIKDEATGESFPSQVSFDYDGKTYQLDATGVAIRKKFFVKVYDIASYLQKGSAVSGGDKFDQILDDNKAKQLSIRWLHEGPLDKIKGSYQEAFQTVFNDSQRAQLQNQINTYTGMFTQDARKGDEYTIRWLPGGYVEVLINGNKVGSLKNAEFAKGLWSIWFGPNSVVNRDSLVSQIK